MADLSLYKSLVNTTNDSDEDKMIKEMVGMLSLKHLEKLKSELDDYYKTIYNSK